MGWGEGCGYGVPPEFGSHGAGCSPKMLVAMWRNDSVAFGGGDFQCMLSLPGKEENAKMLISEQVTSVQPKCCDFSAVNLGVLRWAIPTYPSMQVGVLPLPSGLSLKEERNRGSSYSSLSSSVWTSIREGCLLGKETGSDHRPFISISFGGKKHKPEKQAVMCRWEAPEDSRCYADHFNTSVQVHLC